jgi:hypothetical protein
MISKPVVLGLLAAACITAAASGAYMAVRQNEAARVEAARTLNPAPAPTSAAQPVAETEATIAPPATDSKTAEPVPSAAPQLERSTRSSVSAKTESRSSRPDPKPNKPAARPADGAANQPMAVERPSAPREPAASSPTALPSVAPEPVIPEPPPAPPKPEFVELTVPASSVVGLQLEKTISSETARVEDRVEARVTRDVLADGRLAIPAGARVLGDVTVVERGGKIKEKARLGVRFHTLVLADGTQIPFKTDTIYREGASPGSESSKKIGGAAVGGAILGAIIGGAKGAAIGGATGAAGGTAVVMAGDRNAATLTAGSVVTVRLSSPVSVDVEKEM